jgi:two-component sensor histidine kinase
MNGECWRGEYTARNRAGRSFPVYASDAPVFDEDGKLVAVLGASHDISARKADEEALRQRNAELSAISEELRKSNEEIAARENDLSQALEEKEILLSEIHHRVKNNLTAFISLLELGAAYDTTPAGIAMKKDLQNRALSMALIHETVYRTRNFSRVDVQLYLTTLAGQVAGSYSRPVPIRTEIHAEGITLDIARATPMGLIINELITNVFKYAFPEGKPGWTQPASPVITVILERSGDGYILNVKDNGIGMPPGFDIMKTKTLGLKLVNYLARHQLQAGIEVRSEGGTEFIFRFGGGDGSP